MTTTESQPGNALSAHATSYSLNHFLRIYIRVSVVLMLYVLSTGPMYWAIYESYRLGGSQFLWYLYYPIAVACENDAICRWFDWYVGLWIF